MTARSFAMSLLALAAAAAAAPAAAAQQELAPLKECYVSAGAEEERRERVDLLATGFTPETPIDLFVDGVPVASGQSDLVGDVRASVAAPHEPRAERPFTVTLAERNNPANVVSATTRVTALRVSLRPRSARPSRRVRYRGRGFTGAGSVYAHYVLRGKLRKTVRLAQRPGACGAFDVRRRQIPVRRPRVGNWTVQIDQQKRYAATPETNWVRMMIKVRRVFRNPD